MILNQKLKHFKRVIPLNVKGAVYELDQFRSVLDQVENIRLSPFNVVVANPTSMLDRQNWR